MEKSTTLNLRINPEVKENAEKVLSLYRKRQDHGTGTYQWISCER